MRLAALKALGDVRRGGGGGECLLLRDGICFGAVALLLLLLWGYNLQYRCVLFDCDHCIYYFPRVLLWYISLCVVVYPSIYSTCHFLCD